MGSRVPASDLSVAPRGEANEEEIEELADREAEAGNPWALLYRDARGPEWEAVFDGATSGEAISEATSSERMPGRGRSARPCS